MQTYYERARYRSLLCGNIMKEQYIGQCYAEIIRKSAISVSVMRKYYERAGYRSLLCGHIMRERDIGHCYAEIL